MAELLIEEHRRRLQQLLESTDGIVRIASAYVTEKNLLIGVKNREIRLVTFMSQMDIISGATSVEALHTLIESGVQCRVLLNHPQRLHAKVYIFGTRAAVVTSANLTKNALDSNIEVGVEVGDKNVYDLIEWYDRLWSQAQTLTLQQLAELQQKSEELRRDYAELKKKAKILPTIPSVASPLQDDLVDLLEENTNHQFFVCNTDRRDGEFTATGYDLEEKMYNRGYATAWEKFNYPEHMQQVKPGDAIFMVAKGVGIIGVGRAEATCEALESGDPDRIHEGDTPEWRVKMHWLGWRSDKDAYPLKPVPRFTFGNVSDEKYVDLREGVRQHFLNG